MCAVTRSLKHPVVAALTCFVLGGTVALLGVWSLGTPWNSDRVVEVERVVEKVVEKPVVAPAAKEVAPRRHDLVVVQTGQPFSLGSDFGEFFVEATRKLPGVEQVSEAVVDVAEIVRDNGKANATNILVEGWTPDNVEYEDMKVIEGRKLQAGDRHKILIGRGLAERLNKKVGDKIAFAGDPGNLYEVVGVFTSTNYFRSGGAVIPLADGQALAGKKGRITGFVVRVKKSSPDPGAEVDAVRQKIEALRDPNDPTVRLQADAPAKR